MALIFEDQSVCGVCNNTLKSDDDVVGFPPIFLNEDGPFYLYNDGSFHSSCLQNDQMGLQALSILSEWSNRTGPGNRCCDVCQNEVLDPDDYMMIEYLSDDPQSILFKFNWTHLHKSCLSHWQRKSELKAALQELVDSKNWGGNYPELLLIELSN